VIGTQTAGDLCGAASQPEFFNVHCVLRDDRGSSATKRSGDSALGGLSMIASLPGGAAKQEPALALLQARSCCVRASISPDVG